MTSHEAVHADTSHDVERLAERARRLLGQLTGSEVALDAGCGTGAFAFALARLVGEVVALDAHGEALEAARSAAPPNVRFVGGDVTALPFALGSFDIAACRGVLHHVRRPELVVSELARVTRLGGRVLIVDQLGSIDPLRALEMDRFLRLRDPTHQRLLPDADIRGYLDANDLVLVNSEVTRERVDLGDTPVDVEIGWYVARKPVPS